MLGAMLRKATWRSKIPLLMTIVLCCVAIIYKAESLWPVIATWGVVSALVFQRDAFRTYYEKRHPALGLDLFTRYNQPFRFLVFCENLPAELKTDPDALGRLLRLLEQRQRVRHSSSITRHPAVSLGAALFMILLGVVVQKAADVSIQFVLLTSAFLLAFIVLAVQVGWIWRTRDYMDEELTEFVLWLWSEANDCNETTATIA